MFSGQEDAEQEDEPGCGIDNGTQQQEYGFIGDGIEQDAACRADNSDGDIADQAEESELTLPGGTLRRDPADTLDQHTESGDFCLSW